MNKILPKLMFIETIFIIWFPFAPMIGGRNLGLWGIYILFILALLHSSKTGVMRASNYATPYVKNIIQFVCMLTLGSIVALFLSNNAQFNKYAIQSLFMNIVYVYTYYVFSLDPRIKKALKAALITCSITLGVYSIYSYITASNIYVDFFYIFQAMDATELQFNDFMETRGLAFRVFGNLNNPVYFSAELMLLLGFCCHLYTKESSQGASRWLLLFSIITLFLGTMFTGSKSGIIPCFFLIIMTFYSTYKWRKVFTWLVIYIFLAPSLSDYIDIDINRFIEALNPFAEDTQGSNVNHRTDQFEYLFQFIGSDGLFGRGYGWCSEYQKVAGIHPILHTFESLIMSSYAEGGLFALCLVYPLFMYKFFKYGVKFKSFPFYYYILLSYFFFIIVTGIGCFIEFLIIIAYILSDQENDEGLSIPIKI